MNGPALLSKYLEDNHISQLDFAKLLEVSQSQLFYWLHGSKPRDPKLRKRIEKLTKGAVPETSWTSKAA